MHKKATVDLIKYGWFFILVLFIVYVILLLFLTWPVSNWRENSFAVLGSVGDSFGVLTAFFSGLAFWLALHLFKQQKEEFSRLIDQSIYTARVQRAQLQPHLSFKVRAESNNKLLIIISNDGNGFLRDPYIEANGSHIKADGSFSRTETKRIVFVFEGDTAINWEGPFMDGDWYESRVFFHYKDITDYGVGISLFLTKYTSTNKVVVGHEKTEFYDSVL